MFAQQVMIDLENFKKSSSNMGSTNATSNSFGASGGLARDAAQRPQTAIPQGSASKVNKFVSKRASNINVSEVQGLQSQ